MRRLCPAIALVFLVSFSALSAQTATQTAAQTDIQLIPRSSGSPTQQRLVVAGGGYTMHRNVSLVVLDGVAVDANGNAVTNLTRSDFSIREDGAPQKITSFDKPGEYTPAPNVTINSTADLDRLAPHAPVNIVLLDEFSTRFEDMAYARYSLKKWLDAQPAKLDTPTMLVAVNLKSFTVLRDYTQNKDEILNALNHHFAFYPWHSQDINWSEALYMTAHLALERVAEATGGHKGHKTIIWIGRGFPSNRYGDTSVGLAPSDSMAGATLDQLRAARVTLYTIDPAGIMVHPELDYPQVPSDFHDWPYGGDPQFQSIATASGGRNFDTRNDVDTEIGTAIRDGRSFYTLSYRPPDPDNDPKKIRHIQVTIDRAGVKFISRKAYYPTSSSPHVYRDGKAGDRLRTELIIAGDNNMQYDSVGFTVAASSSDANDMHIHLDGVGLRYYVPQAKGQPHYTRLIVLATTFDKKGNVLKRDAEVYTFDALVGMKHPVKDRLPMNISFKLSPNPKATNVRFIVRVEATGHMGSADLPISPGATGISSAEQAAPTVPPNLGAVGQVLKKHALTPAA